MIRKLLAAIIAITFALMLTACGAVSQIVTSAANRAWVPCEANWYTGGLWSPDGEHIALSSGRLVDIPAGPAYSYIMRSDGTDVTRTTGLGTYTQWLPDGHAIAFLDGKNLFVADLDGTLTEVSLPGASNMVLVFSPDGTRFAFNSTSVDFKVRSLHVANRDGSQMVELLNHGEWAQAWSPDGTRLAYSYTIGLQWLVAVMNADGSDRHVVANGSSPALWSPDGQWIIFLSSKYYNTNGIEIRIVRPDGTGERILTKHVGQPLMSWNPDSKHIAFTSQLDGLLKIIDIDTLKVDTLATIPISDDTYNSYPPSWSPDGKKIAFIGVDYTAITPKLEDIYVVNRDGTGLKRITDNPGRYQCFHWPF